MRQVIHALLTRPPLSHEFKYARTGEDPQKLLQKAVEQIRTRRYGETLHGGKLLRAAIVYGERERKFSVWEQV